MRITLKIKKAMAVAAGLHKNQIRLDDFTPYICHPVLVAIIISNYYQDEDMIVAALLHDMIEDTKYTAEDVEREFGKKIRDLVVELTFIVDEGPGRDWKTQQQEFLASLRDKSDESLIIRAADNIHNLSDTIDGFEQLGLKFLEKFNIPFGEEQKNEKKVLEYMRERLGEAKILDEYQELIDSAKTRILDKIALG